MAVNEQLPTLMPTLYPGSMATDSKPYASFHKMWKAFGDSAKKTTPADNGEILSLPVSPSGAWSSAPSGPRPAAYGHGQGRVTSQTPSWQTRSSHTLIFMSINDPTDPWIDHTRTAGPWRNSIMQRISPLVLYLRSRTLPSGSTSFRPPPAPRPSEKTGEIVSTTMKTSTLSETAGTPFCTRAAV